MLELRTLGALDLRSSGGTDPRPLLKGPKRVAMLAYLAIAEPAGYHRRDSLLAMFWPEFGQQQARSSLRTILHVLRGHLGPDVVVNRGDEEVAIAPAALSCDAVTFREAYAAGRFQAALDLYHGELLPGFFVQGSPQFEDWLSRERARLHRCAFEAAWALAAADEVEGRAASAAVHARQASALCPSDEEALGRLLRLLDRLGDRAGALTAYEQFRDRLQTELDGEPAPETDALIAAIRDRDTAHAVGVGDAAHVAHPSDNLSTPDDRHPTRPAADVSPGRGDVAEDAVAARLPVGPPPPRGGARVPRRWRRVVLACATLVVTALVGLGVWTRTHRPPPAEGRLSLAIGEVTTFRGTNEATVTDMLAQMLSTSLGHFDAVDVVNATRLREVRDGLGANASVAMAARAAGADQLLDGILERAGDGVLRLDLRRIDLRTGAVLAVHRIDAPDPFVLVDRATTDILLAFGVTPTSDALAAGASASLVGFRLYQEGVRAYADGDNRTAQRLLTAALAEDSTFAMAAYYRAQSRRRTDAAAFRADLHLAARLADRASDRERLLIRSAWAQAMDEPAQLALADSLVARYPGEPEGHLFLGKARLWSGAFLDALPHLRRAVDLDSLVRRDHAFRCLACDAQADVIQAYMLVDSLPAAEREARVWTAVQPGSARAWHALASTLEYQGRLSEAQVARSEAGLLRSDNPRDPLYPVVLALRAGEFERADRLLAERDRPGSSLVQQNVLWYRVLSYRYQGRHAEALRVARQYRSMLQDAPTTGHPPVWSAVLEAQVHFELGNHRAADALWSEMAASPYELDSPSRTARNRAWTLTHASAAVAAAGDTGRLIRLADTIEAAGRLSAYGRDPRLHHHVRGLLHGQRGDLDSALTAHRRSLFSTTSGHGRINLELGRTLLALDRPREAADVLTAALRGPLDAANLYVSRSDLHELAGHAWEAAGRPDRAAVHYRWLAGAWRHADPSVHARRADVQRRLTALSR